MKNIKGFALIEVLIAITLITMLTAIVIIAVNPARQFAQGRNTQRWAAVNSILNAVYQNMVDNNGNFNCPGVTISTTTATNISSAVGDTDLCSCLVSTYIAAMPVDPEDGSYTSCTDYDTGYTIMISATDQRITVAAPGAELQAGPISVTR